MDWIVKYESYTKGGKLAYRGCVRVTAETEFEAQAKTDKYLTEKPEAPDHHRLVVISCKKAVFDSDPFNFFNGFSNIFNPKK